MNKPIVYFKRLFVYKCLNKLLENYLDGFEVDVTLVVLGVSPFVATGGFFSSFAVAEGILFNGSNFSIAASNWEDVVDTARGSTLAFSACHLAEDVEADKS